MDKPERPPEKNEYEVIISSDPSEHRKLETLVKRFDGTSEVNGKTVTAYITGDFREIITALTVSRYSNLDIKRM